MNSAAIPQNTVKDLLLPNTVTTAVSQNRKTANRRAR